MKRNVAQEWGREAPLPQVIRSSSTAAFVAPAYDEDWLCPEIFNLIK